MEINHDCDSTRTTEQTCTKRRRSIALQNCYLLNQRRRSCSEPHQQLNPTVTGWANMDFDALKEIFSRVPVIDLLLSVSSACSSWKTACWDFLFWNRNIVDLSIPGIGSDMTNFSDPVFDKTNLSHLKDVLKLREKVCFGDLKSTEIYHKLALELNGLLWSIIEGSQVHRQGWTLSIKTIIVPYDLKIADAHLLYISERTPCLEQLLLLGTSEITSTGFGKAIQNWQLMKEIHIGRLTDDKYAQFLKMLGEHSQELESLHIHQRDFVIAEQTALAIAENLPGLKRLEFEYGYLYSSAIVIFFQMCLQMKEVYFSGCQMVNYTSRPRPDSNISADRPRWFSLSWVLDGQGFAIWKVKPTLFNTDILYEFDEWIFFLECCPLRRLSAGNDLSLAEDEEPVWLSVLLDCMEARVEPYSRLKQWAKSCE